MNNLFLIACGTGLQDGINPCIFMTCAVFIAQELWLKIKGWSRLIFVLVYAAGLCEFNFGPAQIFVLKKGFVLADKLLYFAGGIWAFIMGVLFFKDWILLRREAPASSGRRTQAAPSPLVLLAAAILGAGLSALATVWPINNYIMLLGNMAFLKGQWQAVVPLLAGYILASLWPLWFVWALLSMKERYPSFLRIIFAAIFFTASSCVIIMFIR